MVYTVTFNPAIDYVVKLDDIKKGEINRIQSESLFCGGKGINVSVMLGRLDVRSVALGFKAGFTGAAIENMVMERGVETDFITAENGFSRINMKIKAKEETEINGIGPVISERELNLLYEKIDRLKAGDVLVLAGSIPSCLPDDTYEKIMARLQYKNIRIAVDAARKLLLNVLKYKPFVIKPNNFELAEMFGAAVEDEEDVIKYARELQQMGAVNVLVSMAEKGAILLDEKGTVHICKACSGKAVNTVGAGDSMLAGFIAGVIKSSEKTGFPDYDYALKLGTAAGGATAFSEDLGEKRLIYKLMNDIG